MNRLLVVGLAIGCMGTSGVLFQGMKTAKQAQSLEAQDANDGAFRDGLYLGKMARNANLQAHPPVGRWSSEKDRASFLRGYRQGFGQTLAAR